MLFREHLPHLYGYVPTTVIRIVDCLVLGLNLERMKTDASGGLNARRPWGFWLAFLVLAATPVVSYALTALPFAPVRQQVASDIATLSAIDPRTPAENARLRVLTRANDIFTRASLNDGKALRMLNNKVRRFPGYAMLLDTVASNLVAVFNVEYDFVGNTILPQLSASKDATAAKAQFAKLAPTATRLNAKINAPKTSAFYDPAKRRLDNAFFLANQALILPFPSEFETNSLEATVITTRPVTIKTSSGQGSDTVFRAVATETNIALTVNAIAYPYGIAFSVPDVRPGTFRYDIPSDASFTNRIDIYRPTESNTAATNGAIFISTTTTEIYGHFECSGPGFSITNGIFRITISRP